jgi:hypothetical protein
MIHLCSMRSFVSALFVRLGGGARSRWEPNPSARMLPGPTLAGDSNASTETGSQLKVSTVQTGPASNSKRGQQEGKGSRPVDQGAAPPYPLVPPGSSTPIAGPAAPTGAAFAGMLRIERTTLAASRAVMIFERLAMGVSHHRDRGIWPRC